MKLKFCDRCNESIPHGHVRSTRRGKLRCHKCARYLTGLWRTWVVTVLIGVGVGAVAVMDDYRARDEAIKRDVVARYRHLYSGIVLTLQMVTRLESDHAEARRGYVERLDELRRRLEDVREEAAAKVDAGDEVLGDVDADLIDRVRALETVARALRDDMAEVAAVPHDALQRALRSTVGLTIHETTLGRIFRTGSGVLFSRERDGDEWIYHGFTCYHVYHNVLNYISNAAGVPEAERRDPRLFVHIWNETDALEPSDQIEIELVAGRKVRPDIKTVGEIKSEDDFLVFRFRSPNEFAVSELAPDEETSALRAGSPVLGMGVHPVGRPAVYMGQIASITSDARGNMAVQTMAWPGMSGSPIFDRKTMRVVGIVQKMSTGPGGMNSTIAFTQPLHRINKALMGRVRR